MLDVTLIITGLIGLVWSSDRFVEGAAAIAKLVGLSPLIIGLTIVSIGTSAPEIVVSVIASLTGSGELAVGNALGSNIANTGLVLGLTLIIKSIAIDRTAARRELPQMLVATLLAGALLIDGNLSIVDGLILLSALLLFLSLLARRGPSSLASDASAPLLSPFQAWVKFLVGLLLLIISSRLLVMGAVNVASALGVSELVIGLSIVAIGTSLPELAASIMSALKGHSDIALGAVIGSNIFNLLIVLPVPGVLGPLALESNIFNRDWLVTFITAAVLIVFVWRAQRVAAANGLIFGELGRAAGVSLFMIYVLYIATLIIAPEQSW